MFPNRRYFSYQPDRRSRSAEPVHICADDPPVALHRYFDLNSGPTDGRLANLGRSVSTTRPHGVMLVVLTRATLAIAAIRVDEDKNGSCWTDPQTSRAGSFGRAFYRAKRPWQLPATRAYGVSCGDTIHPSWEGGRHVCPRTS